MELNGRYDGSSKFPAGNQWAFFPSASIGYRISEEAYFGKAKDYVSNLKVRASYGSVGNQEVGSNMFLETMTKYPAGVSWFNAAGTGLLDYFGQPKMVSSALTWETINTTNIGIDLGFLNNSLNVTFDWFQRDTKNMLAPGKELPDVIGINAAYENAGSLRTRGWELTIDWRQQFGKWNVFATANLSDYKSVVTEWDSNNLINGYYTGKEYGEIWGFETDRYFTADDFNGKDDAGNWIYKDGVASQVGMVEKIALEHKVRVVDSDAFQYYESWKYPVIRELAPMMSGAKPRDIADACKEHVSAEEVRDVLDFLVKAGFLKREAEKVYSQTEQTVIGSKEALPIAIRAMHKEMAGMAARAVDRYSASERHFTGVTFSVNEEAYKRITQELDDCCRKVLSIANEYKDQDQVFRINFQLFPVTDKIKEPHNA